jgi:hypothetical protein
MLNLFVKFRKNLVFVAALLPLGSEMTPRHLQLKPLRHHLSQVNHKLVTDKERTNFNFNVKQILIVEVWFNKNLSIGKEVMIPIRKGI